MNKELDRAAAAYEQGKQSKLGQKNPHAYGSIEFLEWNYGRADAELFESATGHRILTRVLWAALALVTCITAYNAAM